MCNPSSTTSFNSEQDKAAFNAILKEGGQRFIFLIIILGIIALALGWHIPNSETYTCHAEETTFRKAKNVFLENGQIFSGGELQSTAQVFEGKYSVKLDAENVFGLEFNSSEILGNEQVYITVWRYNPSGGNSPIPVLFVEGIFWESGDQVIEKQNNGWEKVELKHALPLKAKGKNLRFYMWNKSKETVFIDALTIDIKRVEQL